MACQVSSFGCPGEELTGGPGYRVVFAQESLAVGQ
jgi:hypothetical protein